MRATRYRHCGERRDRHNKAPFGDKCTNDAKCANCCGPYKTSHNDCPAKPRRVSGRIIKLTKKDVGAIRKIGSQATQRLRVDMQQQMERAREEDTISTATGLTHLSSANNSQETGEPSRKRSQLPAVQAVILTRITRQSLRTQSASAILLS